MPRKGLYIIWLSKSKFYGGRSINVDKRCADHLKFLKRGTHENPIMQNVFNKHGTFTFSLLQEIEEPSDQIAAEQSWLDQNCGTPNCMNISPSAQVPSRKGTKSSSETRKKISQALKGRPLSLGRKATAETKLKMSLSKIGKPKPDGFRSKMSLAAKLRGISPETRGKITESLKGTKHSEETKRKRNTSLTGMKRSEESRENMRKAWRLRKERKLGDIPAAAAAAATNSPG